MSQIQKTLKREEIGSIQDHCGIVAAYCAKNIDFFETGVAGLMTLQTRGYDGAGVVTLSENKKVEQYKDIGMVNEVFTPEVRKSFSDIKASIWIYQVRYGTSGDFTSNNVQPMVGMHKKTSESFIVAHNGQFAKNKISKAEKISDTTIFVRDLAKSRGMTWDERIASTLSAKSGAWSLVVATSQGLYLARDPFGFRPLVYGHLVNGDANKPIWVVASETSALETMGVTDFFELLPGTLAKITTGGLKIIEKIRYHKRALCIFENIYIHHGAGKAHLPRRTIRNINSSPTVDDVRKRSGKILAREAPLTPKEVDIVIGVPGTGIEGGMAYARTLNLPYFQAITDRANQFEEQRTFMSAMINSIYQKVLNHFNFDNQALKGRRVVLVDDSIVRGNITKGLVYLLKAEFKVKTVHLRILSPPIDKTCHLGINTRSSDELIAAKYSNNIEKIRYAIGADSLHYLSATGLKEAITGDPYARGFCMGCMAGHKYPIDEYGKLKSERNIKKINLPTDDSYRPMIALLSKDPSRKNAPVL